MSAAIISTCGQYRYTLSREGDLTATSGPAVFIMLNPSTADATTDDPTIRRCRGFAQKWGCNGFVVLNLYAFRATDPSALWAQSDPIGPENDNWLKRIALSSANVVCAWGMNAKVERVTEVAALLTDAGVRLKCLGVTKSGAPRHPLYVAGGQDLIDWITPWSARTSQCGDCGGTRKVDGKPCKICCPTDDGPEGGDEP